MNLIGAKAVTMSVLGVVSIFCGMIPLYVVRRLGWSASPSGDALSPFARTVVSGLLCFGGGVLMGTGFLHMLPEIYEGWQTYARVHQIDVNLSLGIVVICAGFFLVYFVEEVVHLLVDRHLHTKADVTLHQAVSIRSCPVNPSPPSHPAEEGQRSGTEEVDAKSCTGVDMCQSECADVEVCCQLCPDDGGSAFVAGNKCSSSDKLVEIALPATGRSIQSDRYGTFRFVEDGRPAGGSQVDRDTANSESSRYRKHAYSNRSLAASDISGTNTHETYARAALPDRGVLTESNSRDHGTHSHHHSHHHHHHHYRIQDGNGVKAHGLFIIVALSFHEILEGMAVGLQSDQTGVLQLFAAIASHKFVISFCVGLELAVAGVTALMHTVYIMTFSLVTPIGVGIGMAMTAHGDEGEPDEALGSLVMQGLACGTILYVAFFEILERERAKAMVGLLQWSLILLGFLAMLGLQSQAREWRS